ncbi:Interleukin-17D [Liparis tanakae]|uniref:Interleukin-17D n=1 Tax=Liparis tanakae TaxID=230148 RepID=A0A4Z2H815_9TELE|nr:Interleukin-17D [Liparis tanakae]
MKIKSVDAVDLDWTDSSSLGGERPFSRGISFDPARYPRYIPEAYCLCRGCLLGPGGEESRLYRSAPVFAPAAILRRAGSCAGGRHAYTERYVSVAVGCTCLPLPEKERDRSPEPRGRQPASTGRRP